MYIFKTYTTGKFEIYNQRRDKVVFSGVDAGLRDQKSQSLKFKDVQSLLSGINNKISLATFKKISKVLCAW